MNYYTHPYINVFDVSNSNEITLIDHLNGFSLDQKNHVLDKIQNYQLTVYSQYILSDEIKQNYPNLNLKFSLINQYKINFESLENYKFHASKNLTNFICSFNGTEHISRQFLVSALSKFGWFNTDYCTKNFVTSRDRVDGNILKFVANDEEQFYRKFLLTDDTDFYRNIYTIDYDRFNHSCNLNTLKDIILCSFVQIVSETIGNSYYPFITEKFLYPILLKTLWITYGQPGWHHHIETYYGFKKYNKVFNYQFDLIKNPIIRLIELLTMLSKFEKLSKLDWHDLYLLEQETIEYNYDWFMSKKYLEKLKTHA